MHIIDYKNNANRKVTQQELSEYFSKQFKTNISRRTIGDILKNEDLITRNVFLKKDEMLRIKKPKHSNIENEMINFVNTASEAGFILNEDLLKSKAIEFSKKHGIENFKASNGWFDRFKKRNKLQQRILSGETGDISINDFTIEVNEIKKIIMTYSSKDIFNMDETGLLFKEIPIKTISYSSKKGFKKIKERLSIVLCCNADGTEKYPLTIIGKSKKPRCFKNFNVSNFCNYVGTNRAWMNSSIFTNWLYDLNKHFKKQRRNTLLLLDNAPSHKINIQCSNIQIVFLPPNSTGILQPLDAGIIRSFKASYKKNLLREVLVAYENGKNTFQCFKDISIKDAIIYCRKAWDEVLPSTIINCWKKTGFIDNTKSKNAGECEIIENKSDLNDMIQSIFPDNFLQADEYLEIENVFDEELMSTINMVNDEELDNSYVLNGESSSSEKATALIKEKPIVTFYDAFNALKTIENFLFEENIDEKILSYIYELNNAIFKIKDSKKKQWTIYDFF